MEQIKDENGYIESSLAYKNDEAFSQKSKEPCYIIDGAEIDFDNKPIERDRYNYDRLLGIFGNSHELTVDMYSIMISGRPETYLFELEPEDVSAKAFLELYEEYEKCLCYSGEMLEKDFLFWEKGDLSEDVVRWLSKCGK